MADILNMALVAAGLLAIAVGAYRVIKGRWPWAKQA